MVNYFPSFAAVKRVSIKDINVKSQFKSCKASEVLWVDRVMSLIWVILSTFHNSALELCFH